MKSRLFLQYCFILFLLFHNTTFVQSTTNLHEPTIEIYVQHAREFTALDPLGMELEDEYGFSAFVHVRGHVIFRRATPIGFADMICLDVLEMNAYFCPKEQQQVITTVPTTIPFEFTLEMGIGTYVMQVTVPVQHQLQVSAESPTFFIDVVPGTQQHLKKAYLPPFPFPSVLVKRNEIQKTSVLIFDSTTIGGQQILDLVKSRLLSLDVTLEVHFLAEPLFDVDVDIDNKANNDNNDNKANKENKENKYKAASSHGPLIQHYRSLDDRLFVHLLVDLVGFRVAFIFMNEKLEVLRNVLIWEELDSSLKTELFPLLVLLQQMDLISLPNSLRDPKLFNMLHMARLANVNSRIVELANIMSEQDMIESATMFVGPSTYACTHRLITKFAKPCVVIHPVGIDSLNDILFSPKQEVSLPFKSTRNNNNETETVTFASVGRVYLNRNPGLFVRAAVHAAHILYTQQTKASVEIVFIGKCNDDLCKALQKYLLDVPEEYRPLFRFVGEVKHEEVGQTLRDLNVDVVVNSRLLETFGISIVEAMAMGIPVVACRGGGHNDIIENEKDGLLVNCVNKPEIEGGAVLALGTAMLEMIHGGVELREKLGQQGFLSATTKFSTKILKEKYVALYNGLSL